MELVWEIEQRIHTNNEDDVQWVVESPFSLTATDVNHHFPELQCKQSHTVFMEGEYGASTYDESACLLNNKNNYV